MEPMRSDAFIHFYVAADESTSGWEFYCSFLNPHTSVYTLQLKKSDDTKRNEDSNSDDEFTVCHPSKNLMIDDQSFRTVQIKVGSETKRGKFKIDTGSQVNILPKRLYDAV